MSRRKFLQQTSLLGGASFLGLTSNARAEPPPETGRVTFVRSAALCTAPQYIAESMLKAEGFTEIRYARDSTRTVAENVASGDGDFGLDFAGFVMSRQDVGDPLIVLAGVHAGCYTLYGGPGINGIRDLKGKKVAVLLFGGSHHLFVASMAAYIGLNPRKEIVWVQHTSSEEIKALSQGTVDAVLAFEPEQQELRAKGIGHVVVDTSSDRPWSQYFCCVVAGNRSYVEKNPVATKRAMRALMKSIDLCASRPEMVARSLTESGYAKNEVYALQTLKALPYDRWRTFNPEDTMRFYGLRLHEAGMIRSTPQRLIEQGTDWRFLNELKMELKA